MAHFYGEIQGNRGCASRTGSAASGLWAHVRGWQVGCYVECDVSSRGGDTRQTGDEDVLKVYATGGSTGGHERVLIATLYQDGTIQLHNASGAHERQTA